MKPFRPAMTIAELSDDRLMWGGGAVVWPRPPGSGIVAAQSPPGAPPGLLIGQPLKVCWPLEADYGAASAHPGWEYPSGFFI